jgi:lipoteichoic acid synthase
MRNSLTECESTMFNTLRSVSEHKGGEFNERGLAVGTGSDALKPWVSRTDRLLRTDPFCELPQGAADSIVRTGRPVWPRLDGRWLSAAARFKSFKLLMSWSLFSSSVADAGDSAQSSPLSDIRKQRSRMFANFAGLAAVMLLVRFMILKHPALQAFLFVLLYQDVLVCATLAWLFYGLLSLPLRSAERRLIVDVSGAIAFFLAVYTAIGGIVYNHVHGPLTYQIWLASNHLNSDPLSLQQILSPQSALYVVSAILVFLSLSVGLRRVAPNLVEQLRKGLFSLTGAALLLFYLVGAHAWTLKYVRYLPSVRNAELAFIFSACKSGHAVLLDTVEKAYLGDFTHARGPENPAKGSTVPILGTSQNGVSSLRRARNVVMIVMESVGTRQLQLYNGPYDNTPQIMRLAQHGVVFDRIYAAEADTSASMTALFCSLYPQHESISASLSEPDTAVLGVADVLAHHGYITTFMHSGAWYLNVEKNFLADHGFQRVLGKVADDSSPADPELFSQATTWIQNHSKRPFFVALWTQDTHYPYVSSKARDYRVDDANHNRYLNAVRSTDELVGSLARALDKMKLSDDTVLVITGNHGEAFGEHRQTTHNWTVFDEELRVPLLFVNPKVFPRGYRTVALGRQIDIAPTLLAFLGYEEPQSWQGQSLFTAGGSDRAYLFSRYGDFVFGLVEGPFKYIYDFNRDRTELYNLVIDPAETHDLSSEGTYSDMMARDRTRIDAWIAFQNAYLRKFRTASKLVAPESLQGALAPASPTTHVATRGLSGVAGKFPDIR